ncbi:MAG: GNAT family N-acetyltransferase [Phycisphaerae bacterium]|nr:GNAT family N-acetyltransferase [Saprospiraceae bacterium]
MHFEIIETKRLILKGLSPNEMRYIFENCSKDEIKRILGHRSEEDYQKEESKYKNGYSSYNRSFKLFLMTDKASNAIIGRCGLHNWNAEHRRAEIGYVMEDERYKRKGLMTEALEAIIEYGFNKMNLNRMEALVGTENVPSLRLMEKFNFIKEGLLRQHYYVSGEFEDSVLFSKLYHEYINEKHKQ